MRKKGMLFPVWIMVGCMAASATFGADSLRLAVTLSIEEILLGEPLYAVIQLENQGKEELTVPSGVGLPSRFLRIEVNHESGKYVPHIGPDAEYSHVSQTKQVLSVGGHIERYFELSYFFAMIYPGKYTIHVAYEGHADNYYSLHGEKLKGIWEGRVEASELEVTVKEPQGTDKEAYDFMLDQAMAKVPVHKEERAEQKAKVWLCHNWRREFTNDLHEKFPSSLYTAYALWERRKPNFAPTRGDKPATPQEIVESLLWNARNPVNEYDRSVRPGKRKEEIEDLWLILKHQPEFAFLDGVYEALGLLYVEEQDLQQSQRMFEKVAGATKDAKRKERMGAFVETMKGRADKPEREVEQPKVPAEKQPE